MTGEGPFRPSARRVLIAHPGAELYGSDRMVLETVRGLREHGHDVVVALPGPGPLIAELEATGARVLTVATPVVRKSALSPRGLAGFAAGNVAALPRLVSVLRRQRPDVVVVNTVTLPLWHVAAKALRLPLVVHVHEAERLDREVVVRGLFAPLMLADTVIANSRFTREMVTRLWPRLAQRTQVVLNSADLPDRRPGGRVLAPLGEPPRPRLLFLGRVSPRKGTDVAFEAVRLLRASGMAVTMEVVGAVFPGYEWFEEKLRSTYAGLLAEGAVVMTGFQAEPWRALDEADIVVVPSLLPESFGLVAAEAMLAGRPVVVSDAGALPEVVEGVPSARVVPAGDAAALAEALRGIVRDWAVVAARAETAGAEVAERFAPARYRDAMSAIIEACR